MTVDKTGVEATNQSELVERSGKNTLTKQLDLQILHHNAENPQEWRVSARDVENLIINQDRSAQPRMQMQGMWHFGPPQLCLPEEGQRKTEGQPCAATRQ